MEELTKKFKALYHREFIGNSRRTDRTLFLDEVGDLSKKAQTKLLRFLESGEIQAVGSSKVSKCDVRLISATSRNIEDEVAKGLFREDLYYRLNVARIEMPPLRIRNNDIRLLFDHFISAFCRKDEIASKQIETDVYDRLKLYSWPGNVRQLRNIAERLILLTGPLIGTGDLESILDKSPEGKVDNAVLPSEDIIPLKEYKNLIEKKYIEKVIQHFDGNVAKAAKALELDRTYLHQKINQLNIKK
ncbi:MAG: sigma-54-dependent Fis family transcriptional regulator [Oligoflexales bacterium]|nr:sigma-54-dependent Fis family transcriptional regulator [Oligoflexales bacterium]